MAVMMLNNIPDVLKEQFKKACAEQNKSMAKVANELFERFVWKHEQNKSVKNYAKMDY